MIGLQEVELDFGRTDGTDGTERTAERNGRTDKRGSRNSYLDWYVKSTKHLIEKHSFNFHFEKTFCFRKSFKTSAKHLPLASSQANNNSQPEKGAQCAQGH